MARILVIDDDIVFCRLLKRHISVIGHDVDYVNTLNDGLKSAVSGLFDVVYLDVRMPDGNGLDLLPKLHSVESAPEIILITG